MKKLFLWLLLLGISLIMPLSFFVAAEDPPGMNSTNVPGQSSVQTQWMPGNVQQWAQQQQNNALSEIEKQQREKRYNECIATNPASDNPNNIKYCNCVADGWIKLNTDVPFIGRCINKEGAGGTDESTTSTAFSDLIGGLSKIVVTAILVISFMFIIIGGVQWASWDPKAGKDKIKKVAIWLAILGASGAILRLINPNFFQ